MLAHLCAAVGAGAQELLFALGEALSVRAYLGWTTGGHTAVDVNLYGYTSPSSIAEADLTPLRGNHENTEIGEFIRDYLELDLNAITAELRYEEPPAAPLYLATGRLLTTSLESSRRVHRGDRAGDPWPGQGGVARRSIRVPSRDDYHQAGRRRQH